MKIKFCIDVSTKYFEFNIYGGRLKLGLYLRTKIQKFANIYEKRNYSFYLICKITHILSRNYLCTQFFGILNFFIISLTTVQIGHFHVGNSFAFNRSAFSNA